MIYYRLRIKNIGGEISSPCFIRIKRKWRGYYLVYVYEDINSETVTRDN